MFAPPPLPSGWTEHKGMLLPVFHNCITISEKFLAPPKAPSGHTYYYNAATKQSTYIRPLPPIHMGGPVPGPPPPFPPVIPPAPVAVPSTSAETTTLSDPAAEKKAKKAKKEKPAKKTPISGTQWIRVVTNLGNVFYTHTERKESVWTCPEEIAEAVAELEREEEASKAAELEQAMRERAERERKEKEELEKAEVERVKREAEAAGAKRKAEGANEGAAKKPRMEDEAQDEEEWQRQVAEEMAQEEQAGKKRAASKEVETSVPPVFKVPDQVKLDPEEAKALFIVRQIFHSGQFEPDAMRRHY
jgi:hypothetical protein